MGTFGINTISRIGLAPLESEPQPLDLVAGQALSGIITAVSADPGAGVIRTVIINIGGPRITAETTLPLAVGDHVQLSVAANGTPTILRLISREPAENPLHPAAEKLQTLLKGTEESSNLPLRELLDQAPGADSLARQLGALLKPVPLDVPVEQLALALAQQIEGSGVFLEGKLKNGVVVSDAKSIALKLLAELGNKPGEKADLQAALGKLVEAIESRQARNYLELLRHGELTLGLNLDTREQGQDAELSFGFNSDSEDGSQRLGRISLSLNLSRLGPVTANLLWGKDRKVALEMGTADATGAAIISGELPSLRQALNDAGFQVVAMKADIHFAHSMEMHNDTGPMVERPVLINERA